MFLSMPCFHTDLESWDYNAKSVNVLTKVISATTRQANHPAVDVSGLLGEYALTGIGANVELVRAMFSNADTFSRQA